MVVAYQHMVSEVGFEPMPTYVDQNVYMYVDYDALASIMSAIKKTT